MTILPTAAFLLSSRTAVWVPLANHLWQSTLFAAIAGLVTLVLRKNRAQMRYWIWFTASTKFLLPFSLLVSLGSHLRWLETSAISQPAFFFAMQRISQPFASARSDDVVSTVPTMLVIAARLMPILLLLVWFCGCAAVLFFWWLRWSRIAAMRGALPLTSGREHDTLRRLEQTAGIAKPVKVVISESSLEPGIVGIFRPILLLPEGIANRLTDAQLEAILTHELCHVRRQDNMAAVVHMLVEAIFWFHPLVWWMGTRLIDERERACDEEVLSLGREPQVYAEGILKVCEFYLESPLFCAAGVTGSNLKKRIEAIMTHRSARKLGMGKKLLLATMGVAAALGPVAIGSVHPASTSSQSQSIPGAPLFFENLVIQASKPSASPMAGIFIKPGADGNSILDVTNFSLLELIRYAYGLDMSQISGGPAWAGSEKYDISATLKGPIDHDQVAREVRKLLADRFSLTVHKETKELPEYELVVGKGGPKLREAPADKVFSKELINPPGHLAAERVTMEQLGAALASVMGRVVFDRTGLKGAYDFTLDWTAEVPSSVMPALMEQLGLELYEKIAPVETLIIDHAEEVTSN